MIAESSPNLNDRRSKPGRLNLQNYSQVTDALTKGPPKRPLPPLPDSTAPLATPEHVESLENGPPRPFPTSSSSGELLDEFQPLPNKPRAKLSGKKILFFSPENDQVLKKIPVIKSKFWLSTKIEQFQS